MWVEKFLFLPSKLIPSLCRDDWCWVWFFFRGISLSVAEWKIKTITMVYLSFCVWPPCIFGKPSPPLIERLWLNYWSDQQKVRQRCVMCHFVIEYFHIFHLFSKGQLSHTGEIVIFHYFYLLTQRCSANRPELLPLVTPISSSKSYSTNLTWLAVQALNPSDIVDSNISNKSQNVTYQRM